MIGSEYSGHDYAYLQERWEALASKAGLEIETLAFTPGGKPVLVLENGRALDQVIYLSAGVHGDECAPVWGLLHWAELNAAILKETPFTIFPCFNPEGLVENTRDDQDGNDLNRSFSDRSIKVIAAWQDWIGQRRYSRCLHLHEDYDARCLYAYELCEAPRLGREMLETCSQHIAIDPRPEIDGFPFERGVATQNRREVAESVAKADFGGVEAYRLILHHSDFAMTFESPSELALESRIAAHFCAIDVFVSDSRAVQGA